MVDTVNIMGIRTDIHRHVLNGEPGAPDWLMVFGTYSFWIGVSFMVGAVVAVVHGHVYSAVGLIGIGWAFIRWARAETRTHRDDPYPPLP
jgi:hypothetical protein